MGYGPGNFFNEIKDEVLKAVVAIVLIVATGLLVAMLSGAWQTVLLAASGLSLVLLVVVLATAGTWDSRELEDCEFDEMRAEDAERRQLAKSEREQLALITRAATRSRETASQSADVSTVLERSRKLMSTGRASPIELLVIDDTEPNSPRPVAQAGRFDQAILTDPAELTDWIESLGDRAHASSMQVDGEIWRVIGIADTTIDAHDKFEIQRVVTHLAALKLAHRVARGGSLEESA